MKLFLLFGLITVVSTTMANEVERVVQGNNKFGAEFFKLAAKDDGNLVLSPFSAHVALTMAYQGAGGKTAQEMGTLLGFTDPAAAANGYHSVVDRLKQVKSVVLDVANKIYVKQNFHLKPTFNDVLKTKFESAVQQLNFKESAAAAKTINDWVSEKTKDKIHDLISPDMLDDLTRLVLVNAIYFKGNWAKKFDKSVTRPQPFYLLDGSETQVDMMYKQSKYRYGEDSDLDCKLLELPYEGNEMSMLVLLPNERNGITKLQEKIQHTDVAGLLKNMYETTVSVDLPKFKIESTIKMNEILKQMGAEDMFTDNADFSNITDEDELKVSEVVQKAFIEVNEDGAEAAAATGMIMMTRCMPIPQREQFFKADHAFLVKLVRKDSGNGTVLFIGRVTSPN